MLRAVGRILLGWVRAPEAWGTRGIRGYISPGNFVKSSCWSPLFLHSESHFSPPSQLSGRRDSTKRTTASLRRVRECRRTPPPPPPPPPPPLPMAPLLQSIFKISGKENSQNRISVLTATEIIHGWTDVFFWWLLVKIFDWNGNRKLMPVTTKERDQRPAVSWVTTPSSWWTAVWGVQVKAEKKKNALSWG